MFDKYKYNQPIVCEILINAINNDKISHAYLFELNGYMEGYNLAIDFAKILLSNNGVFEFKIIEPDGQNIKKEQLEELQKEFNEKSLNGDRRVYIIKEAEKLNVSSANSLLKFLEEPPSGVVAILLTNNIHLLLPTIVSRCQILPFKRNNIISDTQLITIANLVFEYQNDVRDFIDNNGQKYVDSIIEYILYFEEQKLDTLISKNKELLELFDNKKQHKLAFDIMILLYKDVINYKINQELLFDENLEVIKKISDCNSLLELSNKIKILVELKSNIDYNVNMNLLLDKLIILLSEVKND